MPNWLTSFKFAYLDGVLELLWLQWSNLGVLGQRDERTKALLDPEAMIIATVHFGRYDPRLFDAAVEWCLLNESWLSSARLQRLQQHLDSEGRAILSAIAGTLLKVGRSAKWRSLSQSAAGPAATDAPASLFRLRDERPLPQTGGRDPIFLRHGLRRPIWESRGLSVITPLRNPAALRIRLRALIGVTSRVEIILYLLTHGRAHPRLVARQAHYAQPPVAKAMKDMALSGFISQQRTGREVEYGLDRLSWIRFLGVPEDLVWANWHIVFLALVRVWKFVASLEQRNPPRSVLGSELSRCAQEIRPMLYEGEVDVHLAEGTAGQPESYPDVFMSDMRALLRRLTFVGALLPHAKHS